LDVVFCSIADMVLLALASRRETERQNLPLTDRSLSHHTCVESFRVERFEKGFAGRRQKRGRHRAAVALPPHHASRGEQRAAGPIAPKEARTRDAARIASEVGPAVVIDVT